jgi:hypothetical protein
MKTKLNRILALCLTLLLASTLLPVKTHAANPIISDIFTADPTAIVHGDTVYLYAGQDESPGRGYRMFRWVTYSSKDMNTWTSHGSLLSPRDFSWARGDEAWASHVIEKNGKFYWYVSTEHNTSKRGKAIGVAVSDSPIGPFKDARGSALITADMTSNGGHGWEDIDPAVFTDTDGTSYIFWGNRNCFYARLKPNMIELDSPIMPVGVPWFTEAPWVHKRGNLYYLSYASYFPEKIAYATAPSINGPWTYRGIIADVVKNSETVHQAIIEFKGQWYFIYHNGALPTGSGARRSVTVDYLYYNSDGTMRKVVQTTEGTSVPPVIPTTPEVNDSPVVNRLQSVSNPELFVRHMNYSGVLAPVAAIPFMDSVWKAVPGLSNAKGISFESVSFPEHFLRRQGEDVMMAKNDGSAEFKASATFIKEPGLADAAFSSFRSAAAPGQYIRQFDRTLRMGPVVTATDRASASFRLTEEGGVKNVVSPIASARTSSATTTVTGATPAAPQTMASAASSAADVLRVTSRILPVGSALPRLAVPTPTEKDMAAYLFVYFKDEDHSLHMALSRDGYTFTNINGGKPVMDGKILGEQKGIRDPHIMRGPDGAFYLAMTDLHIFARRDGLRTTEWERPGEQYGWGNNRALVLMKSYDLVNWTHSIFRVDKAFPELGNIGAAWAPHIIWDAEKGKPMVSFTMRMGNGLNRLYYSYPDKDFTKLETRPELLFEYPRDISYIDSDITKVGGKYHLFYVAHERGGGIKQAVSDKINGSYKFDPAKYDPERVAAEAPNVWRRIGTDTYVFMYDVYGIRPHNFGFSETTDFVNFKHIGRFNEGVMKTTNFSSPKHGAIIHLTADETKRLAAHWKSEF